MTSSLSQFAILIEQKMADLLPKASQFCNSKLVEAMHYSATTKGKRIRPFLTFTTAGIFDANKDAALNIGAALEFIHIYSLIHDDLPAMDDDDFRRGQPSCHKKFDEATAILAGDSLLTFAFEILSGDALKISADIKCKLINIISKAIGFEGMAGGQMLDLEAKDQKLSEEQIFKLHHLKTGRMIIAAIEAGAILGGANEAAKNDLINYGANIGLAFQIKDDILDFEENLRSPKTKPDPASIVNLIGLEKSVLKLQSLKKQAYEDLKRFGKEADPLRDLAEFIIERKN
ncbi:MAG: Farnesyl-diphosphate synthase [Rickettsiaceae bacterium]|jgi:farnesyl diphosphate synthase|nr:Farnesyl-diphosphate synthase [Rickettsiaceae bacterium]